MNNDQYNDFLNAAWNLAGKMAHDEIELVAPDDSFIQIDPECELRLCVEDPDKLEQVKYSLECFKKAISCQKKPLADSDYGQV